MWHCLWHFVAERFSEAAMANAKSFRVGNADDLCPDAFRVAAIDIFKDFAMLVKTTKLGDSSDIASRKR